VLSLWIRSWRRTSSIPRYVPSETGAASGACNASIQSMTFLNPAVADPDSGPYGVAAAFTDSSSLVPTNMVESMVADVRTTTDQQIHMYIDAIPNVL
jgi:hypothetical protein